MPDGGRLAAERQPLARHDHKSNLRLSSESLEAMDPSAVRTLVAQLDEAGVPVWLDGGWGVDALLRRQTRAHHDLDIIVRVSDVPALLAAREAIGFAVRDGSIPHSFVLANPAGLQLDVHSVTVLEGGIAVHRMENGQDWVFPPDALSGMGTVDGASVRCLSPDTQVRCHAQGYRPTEKDFQDMEQLRVAFGVILPPVLQRESAKNQNQAG